MRSWRQALVATIGSTLLAGCWLFPPFLPLPEGPQIVVDNRTETDWVVELRSDVPIAYAVPAGEEGTVESWGLEVGTLVLMTDSCEEVDAFDLTSDVTNVRIDEPGSITVSDAQESGVALVPFTEFWGCDAGFGVGEPEAESALPDATVATGSILFYGEDGFPYRFDPIAGTVEAAVVEDSMTDYDLDHTWSPDGRQVAYLHTTEDSGDPSIMVAAADGSDAEVLVESAASPRWSPDGTRIAYQDADPFVRNPGIWIIDLDSRERERVAEGGTMPSWSPKSTHLAYLTADPIDSIAEPTPSDVHVLRVDGSDDRVIGETPPFSMAPAWSPDGTRIAFAAVPEGAEFDFMSFETTIAVYDLATGELTTVAAVDGSTLAEPSWSPDGSRLAFAAIEATLFAGTSSIGLVDAGGGEVTEVGRGEGSFLSTPTWAPDGTWIVATSQGGAAEFRTTLFAVDVSGDRASVVLATGVLSVIAWR